MPTHILGAHLLELRLPVVKIDLHLPLDEEIATLLDYPLTLSIADTHAKMDQVCCVRPKVPLRRG
jgi:hypothetical protein